MNVIPFHPTHDATVQINVGAGSQSVQVYPERGPLSVRIMNNGTATIWINFGDSTVTANTTNGIPVGPGVTEVMTMDNTTQGTLYVAAIAAAATGIVYFTPGRGI